MEDAELLMMSVRLLTRPARRIALATLLLSGLAAVRPGHAAPQVVVDAEDLDLSVPCLGRFEITVDPAMSDGVSIDSSATGGAHLTMRTAKTQGSSKVLITSKSCAPAAKVAILVAPSVGVLIHDSHDTHFVINGTLASLEASLEAGQLDADTIQSLDLSLRGTEQVHIAHLNRAAQVVETGASGLVVDHASLDAFSAQLSETSHLTVTDGRFDVLTLMVENAASVRLGGTVNTATVSASGTGLVAIPNVSGALTRTGNVQVGPLAATIAPVTAPIQGGGQGAMPGPAVPAAPTAPTAAPPVPPVMPNTGAQSNISRSPTPPAPPVAPPVPSAVVAPAPDASISGQSSAATAPTATAPAMPMQAAPPQAGSARPASTAPAQAPSPAMPATTTPGVTSAQTPTSIPDEQPWAVPPAETAKSRQTSPAQRTNEAGGTQVDTGQGGTTQPGASQSGASQTGNSGSAPRTDGTSGRVTAVPTPTSPAPTPQGEQTR